ncbi:hypothetical protein EYC84_011366 [Monilinia fructicola]|uniref:Cutinase n=1 Tax=Monilinia fructicola TaxID=38448 RepID=A0A5M9J989_MONFR|nr:hypothetical protein EYC84_011366 [Monilinia fructicola]
MIFEEEMVCRTKHNLMVRTATWCCGCLGILRVSPGMVDKHLDTYAMISDLTVFPTVIYETFVCWVERYKVTMFSGYHNFFLSSSSTDLHSLSLTSIYRFYTLFHSLYTDSTFSLTKLSIDHLIDHLVTSAQQLLSLLLLPLSAIAAPTGEIEARACSTVTVIFARGTTETPTLGTVIGPQFLAALKSSFGGSVTMNGVPYAADVPGFLKGGDPTGSKVMANMVSSALSSCPNTKLVISGYSQGGQLVHNAAKQLPAATTAKIAAAVIFGDPGSQRIPSSRCPSRKDQDHLSRRRQHLSTRLHDPHAPFNLRHGCHRRSRFRQASCRLLNRPPLGVRSDCAARIGKKRTGLPMMTRYMIETGISMSSMRLRFPLAFLCFPLFFWGLPGALRYYTRSVLEFLVLLPLLLAFSLLPPLSLSPSFPHLIITFSFRTYGLDWTGLDRREIVRK